MSPPLNKARGCEMWSEGWWHRIEDWGDFFMCWQGVEYETHEEGIFKYTYPE